jgi:predicted metal-binding membrane protein
MARPLEAALHRQRAVTLTALAVLTVLAWAWLVTGAGMGMGMQAELQLFPHGAPPGSMAMDMGAPAAWSPGQVLLAFSMWWVMMVAMMLPAAAPVILLYARATSGGAAEAKPATGSFLAGYLAVWGLFSLLAAGLQAALEGFGVLAPMTMGSAAKWFSAAVLIAAGLYQLSPFKEACLSRCRNPAAFLSRHFRPGRAGAFRLGLLHGAYCVGCCWLLMALLFVGGVMNLAWIALLTLLVAAEKLLPGGRRVAFAAGLVFIAWGALTALA